MQDIQESKSDITFTNYTDIHESVEANRICVSIPMGTPDSHPYFAEQRRVSVSYRVNKQTKQYYILSHHLLCRFFPEIALDRHEAMADSGINATHHVKVMMDILAGKYNHQFNKQALLEMVHDQW